MSFTVREAVKSDYSEICKLLAELDLLHHRALPGIFSRPVEPVRSEEYLDGIIVDGNAALFVAESDKSIIGLIHVHMREAPDIPIMVKRKYVYVSAIVVTEKTRQEGVGRALMERAEQWALLQGVTQFELNVWDFNRSAMAFFSALGYTPSRHVMWKSLSNSDGG